MRIEPRTGGRQAWTTLPSRAVALTTGGRYVWATLRGDDAVGRIDSSSGGFTTAAAGRSPTQAVVVGERLFVASRNDNTVVVLDVETTEPASAALKVGLNPYALATDGDSVWVTRLATNTVTRIDVGA